MSTRNRGSCRAWAVTDARPQQRLRASLSYQVDETKLSRIITHVSVTDPAVGRSFDIHTLRYKRGYSALVERGKIHMQRIGYSIPFNPPLDARLYRRPACHQDCPSAAALNPTSGCTYQQLAALVASRRPENATRIVNLTDSSRCLKSHLRLHPLGVVSRAIVRMHTPALRES